MFDIVTFFVLLADRRWWKVMAQKTRKQHQRCSTAVERFTTGAGERTSIQYETTNWGQQDATRNTDRKNGRYFNLDDLGSRERPTTLQLSQLLGGLTWENSRLFATLPLVSRSNDVWETSGEIPYWWRFTTQISVVLIGCAAREICFNQLEALPRSGQWRVINSEFLGSFLRRHLAGKSVVASLNVGCFLRLSQTKTFLLLQIGTKNCPKQTTDILKRVMGRFD